MTSRRKGADVLVAGAGPAGSAAALALATAGADVVLVHREHPSRWHAGESLAPTARPLLEHLGILDRVTAHGHRPCYGHHSAWGQDTVTASDFVGGPYGSGWHLDRPLFDRSMREAAREAGVSHHSGCVTAAVPAGDQWRVTVSGAEVVAPYVVDATGAGARVARRLGARVLATDHLVAVATVLTGAGPQGDTARGNTERTSLIESAAFGWWYTAPLPSGQHIAMAVTDPDLVARAGLRTPAGWSDALATSRHVRERLALCGTRPPQRLTVLRAGTSRLSAAAGPGWVAVGDAATATDPIAARGITTALATGITAAGALTACAGGDEHALERYADLASAVHAEFLRARMVCYRAGRRWDTPFWTRRTEGRPVIGLGEAGRVADARPGSWR
ncbi:NAD(P)/FAD-dependent oxidoreductase [Streptomyces sp. NPDC060022]|uniref:NAD(P)/FAD-dependent oxidoreductase n=1 Tax=Streptomyces sp. NPDC060022 TaxID=3347039 RepID=UPI0036AAEC28